MRQRVPGHLFIVAAPSGGGKTTLVNALVHRLTNIVISISHTTREQRAKEIHGGDYFFIKNDAFLKMIAEDAFVEYARVFDHFYGTSKEQIHDRLVSGTDVLLDIDWQGAQQIKRIFPEAVSIFIVPPSLDVLQARLLSRQRDDEQVIRDRMDRAQSELSHYAEFDYLIVNDDFEKAASELQSIVVAQRLRMPEQSKRQGKLLSFLLSKQ